MNIEDKHCFVIEFDFSNGHPMNAFEDKDLRYKGRDWWTDTGDHEKHEVFAEVDNDVVCDLENMDGSQATMSCLYVSVPKVHKGGREALRALQQATSMATQEDLDMLVYDVLERKASKINNRGLDAQLEFLLKELDIEEILSHIGNPE
jgi:hypothetical protein